MTGLESRGLAYGLLTVLAVLTVALLPSETATGQALDASDNSSANPREITELSGGWRFQFGDQPESVTGTTFDDSTWQKVTIPHTWNRVGEYRLERSEEANAEQGAGWYRLVHQARDAAESQRQYLDFGAVGNVADVWVNGVHVGQHKGAFSRFRFDVTDAWNPGEANVIAVKADNSRPAVGSSTEHVIPMAGDFFIHGGIYRDASLITAHEAGIDLLDYGAPGVYARAAKVNDEQAVIEVLSRLRNSGASTRQLDLVTVIRDGEGREVSRAEHAVSLDPGTAENVVELIVDSPRRWGGRRDPYLYSFTVELQEQGQTVDSVTQPLGIRTFRFDPSEGFFLNERHLKLHGVSRHQDRYGKGWALTPEDHAEDMALIVEMGANTVRHAHYQHADEWSEEANRAGMVVWAEVPYVATSSLSGGKGSADVWANAEQQTRELIRQNYNHPSILMWSIGNEVDSAKGFGVEGDPPKPLALLEHLQQVAKAEDPHRPTIYADCCEDTGMVETAGELLVGVSDLIGYNRYFGWYYPEPLKARERFGEHLDHLHEKFPDVPMSVSEYGGGGAPSQFSDNVRVGALNFTGRPQPDEYLSFVHEQTWPPIAERDFVFASWVWNMFDFTSNLREEGDAIDLNTKGVVTFDREIKKDAFYYYKAQWNPEPMVRLTGKRHSERPYPMMDVKAYTNAPAAHLTWNGHRVGEVECPEGICVWPEMSLDPGENLAIVEAKVNGTPVADEATWIGPDLSSGLRIDSGNLAGQVLEGRRFGSDHFVTGGEPMILNRGGFAGRRMPVRTVEADQAELYNYWRQGEAFSYRVPLARGKWQVKVHTFDPGGGAGSQILKLVANGEVVVSELDVNAMAGGAWKGMTQAFTATVAGDGLQLDISSLGGEAVVAALEFTPSAD